MKLTKFEDLPVSSDRPVTGGDLLAVLNIAVDPALEAALQFAIGHVTSLQPLQVTLPRRGEVLQLAGYAVGSYTPALGDAVVTIASSEHAILLGLAP